MDAIIIISTNGETEAQREVKKHTSTVTQACSQCRVKNDSTKYFKLPLTKIMLRQEIISFNSGSLQMKVLSKCNVMNYQLVFVFIGKREG